MFIGVFSNSSADGSDILASGIATYQTTWFAAVIALMCIIVAFMIVALGLRRIGDKVHESTSHFSNKHSLHTSNLKADVDQNQGHVSMHSLIGLHNKVLYNIFIWHHHFFSSFCF